MAVADTDSGVSLTRLQRDGALVAVYPGNGTFVFDEAGFASGATLSYVATSVDDSGNEQSIERIVQVGVNEAPQVLSVVAPSSIQENSAFSVEVQASDDTSVAELQAEWAGRLQTQAFSGADPNRSHVFQLTDQRLTRPTGPVTETLTVRAIDALGQVATVDRDIQILPDAAPDATAVTVNAPAQVFVGELASVVAQLAPEADDGGLANLTVSLLDITSGTPVEVLSVNGQDTLAYDFDTSALGAADTIRFSLRLVDGLGQATLTEVYAISVVSRPNAIAFEPSSGSVNPSSLTSGAPLVLSTVVLDEAGRGLPGQQVQWVVESGPVASGTVLGAAVSDPAGIATLSLPSLSLVGSYTIRASLVDEPAISASIGIAVQAGDVARIVLTSADEVTAGSLSALSVVAVDADGNIVPITLDPALSLRFPDPGFAFAFSEMVDVILVTDPGCNCEVEEGTIWLDNGLTTVEFAAPQAVGDYPVQIVSSAYPVWRDGHGDQRLHRSGRGRHADEDDVGGRGGSRCAARARWCSGSWRQRRHHRCGRRSIWQLGARATAPDPRPSGTGGGVAHRERRPGGGRIVDRALRQRG